MKDLRDRVAVVTGGASGIGRGMVGAFVKRGMKVAIADIEAAPLAQATAELREAGARVIGVECDVAKAASVDALRDRVLSEFGAVHVLCNNAGVSGSFAGASWELADDEWNWVLGVNLHGVIHGQRSFIPAMIDQGEEAHIVNTASMAGLVPGLGPYGVSKHAVVALSESLFGEFAGRGLNIGVSVLCPGWVRTRIMESERNRPEAPRPELTEASIALARMLHGAVVGMVEKGLDPAEVGNLVADSICARRFYILTHPSWANMIESRMRNILEGGDPAFVAPAGDPGQWIGG